MQGQSSDVGASLWQLQQLVLNSSRDSKTLTRLKDVEGKQSDPADLCSYLSRSHAIGQLEQKQSAEDVVHNWFFAFFKSLELPSLAASLAIRSQTMKRFIQTFSPDNAMHDVNDLHLLKSFWKEVAPQLAKATFEMLSGMQAYSQAQHDTCKNGKFDELSLGDMEAFYVGLNTVIGLPKMNVLKAMEEEHASSKEFKSHNQGRIISSTPMEEWKRILPEGMNGRINTSDYDNKEEVCPDFMQHAMVKKSGLVRQEVIALRLYTSPMYALYNEQLRTLLKEFNSVRSAHGGDEAAALQAARDQVMKGGSGGFVTTIHAIASGLSKLSRISSNPGMVYRGTSGRKIPDCFLTNNQFGGRGGVEYGFLSASTSKREACIYAMSQKEMPILFEIETGMVDRGADLSWLSYFPKEQELLLPPLSSLQWVMVWPLKINVNMKAATLEELLERRKTLHVNMFDNLLCEIDRDLETVGSLHADAAADDALRKRILDQCAAVFRAHHQRPAEWYNADANYKDALTEALNTKKLALRKLQVLLPRVHVGPDGPFPPLPLPPADRAAILDEELAAIGQDHHYYQLLSDRAGFPWKEVWTRSEGARAVTIDQSLSARQVHLAVKSVSSNQVAVNRLHFGSLVLERQGNTHACPNGSESTLAICDLPTPLSKDGGMLVSRMLLGRASMLKQDELCSGVFRAGALDLAQPITSLDLSRSKLFTSGSAELAQGLRGGALHLMSLRLDKCALGLEGGEHVMSALQELREQTLTSLSVRCNVLSDAAQQALGRWLQQCTLLTDLDIGYTCVSEAELGGICEGLTARTSLVSLDVGGNLLSPAACDQLAQAVRGLSSLTSLNTLAIVQGAAVWADHRLARVGAADEGLVVSLVRLNPQLTRLVSLAPPDSGIWELHEQLDGGEERRALVGWWASAAVPTAFVKSCLGINDRITAVTLGECDEPGADEKHVSEVRLEAVPASCPDRIAELIECGVRWMARGYLLERVRTYTPSTVQQNQIVEHDLEGTFALLAAGIAIPFSYHSHGKTVQAALRGGWECCMALMARTHERELDEHDYEGRTALMVAARDGHGSLVMELLRKHADVNWQYREGQTALMLAAGRGRDAVVETLVAQGADLLRTTHDGWTALHFAARYGPDNAVTTLLGSFSEARLGEEAEAAVNAQAAHRYTALHFAAQYGKVRTVELLLERRAEVNVQAKKNMTPIMEAAKNGHAAVVTKLLDCGADVSCQATDLRNALSYAVDCGHVEIADKLIDASDAATRDAVDEDGRTALMLAVVHGHDVLARKLLKCGASVDQAAGHRRTALMEAASANRRQLAEVLMDANADLSAKDADGRTALMIAAKSGAGTIVDSLLSRGAQVNAASKHGWTALMMAAERGHLSVVEALCRRKADMSAKSVDDRTALHLAKRRGHHSVVKLLESGEQAGQGGGVKHQLRAAVTREEAEEREGSGAAGREKEESMYITPREVESKYVTGHLMPRDKYDLMHSTGQAIHFRLDTKVFDLLPVGDNETPLVTVDALVHKKKFLRGKWLQLLSSPLSALTLAAERRTAAAIPKEACYFSFCHPAEFDQGSRTEEWTRACDKESFVNFLVTGGYVYYNAMYDIVQLNSLHVHPAAASAQDTGFRFDTSWEMHPASIEYLDRWNRWNPITVEFLKQKGHDLFAWVNPSEVLGDQFISPYGGFAYRYATNHSKAVYCPITLDADMDVIPAPEHSFMTKVGGTSEGTEDTASDIDHAPPRRLSFSGNAPSKGLPRCGSSGAAPASPARGGQAVAPKREPAWKRKGRLVGETGGVTGLMEVRTEVGEQLRHHLLAVADRVRAEAKEEEERKLASMSEAERKAAEAERQGEAEAEFVETDPRTWREDELPSLAATDSRETKELKIRFLAGLHKCCAKQHRLRMPMPMNLIKVTHFGDADERVPVGECLFPQDLYMLMRSRRNQVQFAFDCKVFNLVSERTREWLDGHFSTGADHKFHEHHKFLELSSSPLNSITLPEDVQVRAGIPRQACFFSFCYPLDRAKYPRNDSVKMRRASLEGHADSARGSRRRKQYRADPLVCFFKQGGFVYFDARYEVVAINALSSAERTSTCNLVYLGPCVDLPRTAIEPLDDAGRWQRVGHKAAVQSGFTHKAWINPSEVLADHIFCGHGGFAFLDNVQGRAEYYPVVKNTFDADEAARVYMPEPYDMCLFGLQKPVAASIDKFGLSSVRRVSPATDESCGSRQLLGARRLATPSPVGGSPASKGSPIEVVDDDDELQRDTLVLDAIREEFRQGTAVKMPDGTQLVREEDMAWVLYVLDQTAVEEALHDYCDQGHGGWKLDDFAASREARAAHLRRSEVAALRIFTTPCHRAVNAPYRHGQDSRHPLPATVACLSSGIAKLRSVVCVAHEFSKFKTKYLWCGVPRTCSLLDTPHAQGDAQPSPAAVSETKLSTADDDWFDGVLHALMPPVQPAEPQTPSFRTDGFTGDGFVSASANVGAVADRCPDTFPVILRIKVSHAEAMAASLGWLSVFPAQQEVLFPPGTALTALYRQGVKLLHPGAQAAVVTVVPTPTDVSLRQLHSIAPGGSDHCEPLPRFPSTPSTQGGTESIPSRPSSAESGPLLPGAQRWVGRRSSALRMQRNRSSSLPMVATGATGESSDDMASPSSAQGGHSLISTIDERALVI